MAETILIDAQAGTLPEGFCPKGPTALQDFYNQIIASTQFALAIGVRFYNFGDSSPTPELRVYPWLKTVSGYPDRWYVFSSGDWLSLHPIPAGPSGFRAGWVGTEPQLQTYDGGEIAVTTLTSGPFWEVDHDFDGRSPMGPGTIPDANPVKAISAGEDYGAGAIAATSDNLPAHTHPFQRNDPNILNGSAVKTVIPGSGTIAGLQVGLTGDAQDDLLIGQNTFTSAQEDLPIIHPVRGLFQIRRTIRKYYRGT